MAMEDWKLNIIVSIHAPAKGATWLVYDDWRKEQVSIHAPAKGATSYASLAFSTFACFNSRTREGCDRQTLAICKILKGFNSRTREGCDQTRRPSTYPFPCFNSRTREGCDICLLRPRPCQRLCFNSRTREGCDQYF